MKKMIIVPPPRMLALHALSTFLIGVGCTYPLSLSLGLTAPVSLSVLCCALVTLLFAGFDCIPRLRALAYPVLFACMAMLAVRYADQSAAIGAALALMMNGQMLALTAYSRALVVLFSLLFTGIGASLSRSEQAFLPLALMTLLLLFAVSFLGADVSALSLLPLVLALLISSRAPGLHAPRIVACSALVLALTALFMPYAGQTLPELESTARQLRQTIGDYLFFTDPRTAFSLSTTGWQPLGVTRLGGPVSPQDTPVMQVYTSGRALLRATIKNDYNGYTWTDTTSGRRYLYVNPRFSALRRNLFDLSRPDRDIRDALLQEETITVLMRSDAASTLFLTQRFQAPSGQGIVPYFSPASEVFGTRDLLAGDRYTFTGFRLTSETPGVRDAVLAAMQQEDPYYETVQNTYLQLSDLIEPQVYALAREITASAENSFDRADALCRYLQSGRYPYTLHQNVPPTSRDFVSWFLLSEQQGYCTSYASALAVMARSLGLPSRYVEGYAADPDVDGIARVTQEDAHAWVEIYFPGFGWLTFDPTPGASAGENGGSGTEQMPPTATPTPTPQAPASPQPTATPAPQEDGATAGPSPSPTPTPQPEEASSPSSEDRPLPDKIEELDESSAPFLAWLVLVLLILAACCALRLALCDPARVAARQHTAGDALLVWYCVIEEALLCLGIRPLPGEAPATFLLRAQEACQGRVTLTGVGKALCIARYSPYRLNRVQPERAQKAYRALLALMNPLQRARLYGRRLIRGIRLPRP